MPTQRKATSKSKTAGKASKKKTTPAKKKAPVKKTTAKKAGSAKKSTTKKVAAKQVTTKKSAPKKAASKKAPAKKTPKKATAKTVKKTGTKKKLTTKVKSTVSSLEVARPKPSELGIMGIPPYKSKRNEEYMNGFQREHFVRILNAWKRSLMEEVDTTKERMQSEAANFPDPNDRATQEQDFTLELRTRDRERRLIKKIEATLERLVNTEDYGYCDACGVEIGIRRLEARPTAILCIDCKTLAEIKERQTSG